MSRESLESRTNEKLEFARIHLQELRGKPEWNPSSAFVLAHEESCLFHVVGVKDAFLQEINAAYGLGLEMNKVDEKKLGEALKNTRKTSIELDEINKLRKVKKSWLALVIELRNHGTHRARVARVYHVGGTEDGMVHYRSPKHATEIHQNIPDFLGSVIENMRELIQKLRPTLPW